MSNDTTVAKVNPLSKAPITLPEWNLSLPEAVSMLTKSGMFGKSMSYEQAVAKAMIGRAMGMEPVEALRMIDVFDGNISIRSEYRAARIKRTGCDYRVTKHTEELCSITFYDANKVEVGSHTFTIQDAQRMGLVGKDNWKKNPKVMLFWRCLSQGQRMYLPDVLGTQGIYDEDEIEDIRRARREEREDTREAAKALTSQVMGAGVTVVTENGEVVDVETGEIIEDKPEEVTSAPEDTIDVPHIPAEDEEPSADPGALAF